MPGAPEAPAGSGVVLMVPPEDSAPASSAKVKRRLVRTSRRGGGHAGRWPRAKEEITSSHRGCKRSLFFSRGRRRER